MLTVERDTYECLVNILPDIRHYLGIISAGQDRIQGMMLDGLQQTSGVTKTQYLLLIASQSFHQIIHRNV